MNDDFDLIRRQIEQPAGLDHFERLIHQRRRIDSDLWTHLPRRMTQCVVGGHVSEVGPCSSPERAATGCEYHAADLARLTAGKRLKYSAVLTIYRNDRC